MSRNRLRLKTVGGIMRRLIRKQVHEQEGERGDANGEERGMVPSMDGVDSKTSTFIEIEVGGRAEDVMGGCSRMASWEGL